MAASALNLASMLSPANLLQKNSSAAPAKAQTMPTTGSTTGTTGSGGLTGTSVGSTFLNLLVKELQNQDPTAPMDSTAMVGQMISLNQLDQLISINQVLSTVSAPKTGSTPTPPVAHASPIGSSAQLAQRSDLLNSLQNTGESQSASASNQTLDLSNLNIPYGGK